MQIILVISILNSSIPTLVSGILIEDASSISYYITANKIALLCAVPIGAISNIIAPRIATFYHKREIKKLSEFIQTVNLFFILLATFITIILITFSGPIMSIFGKEFIQAKNILIILSFGQFVNLCAGCVGFLLSMTSYHKLLFKIIFWNTLIFALLTVLLAYGYGILGIAIAVSLNLCSLNIAYAISVKKKLQISILPNKQLVKNYVKDVSMMLNNLL